jgi:protein subunit release factor A
MVKIEQSKVDTREKVRILSRKDLDISYYCGPGKGGSAKNKVASGVLLTHRETGAQGRCSDSRSQADNQKEAFKRLLATPKMKFWLAAKIYEVRTSETLEETVEKSVTPDKLKLEIKDEEGKWKEVPNDYFETAGAKYERD